MPTNLFKPGQSGNPGGCPKGIKHKSTQIKEAFYNAFDKVGGIDDLVKWINSSQTNKKEFYKLLVGMLPKELQGDLGTGAKVIIIKDKLGTDKPDSNRASSLSEEVH